MCVCDNTWGWNWKPTPSSSTNLLQTKTKRIQRRGICVCLHFFIKECQHLLFKGLTPALQSNKNLFLNWLRSPNFSGFWCNSKWNVQYFARSLWKFTNRHCCLSFSPVRNPGPSTGAGAETEQGNRCLCDNSTSLLWGSTFFPPNLLWLYIFVPFHFLTFKDTFAKMKSARTIKANTTPPKLQRNLQSISLLQILLHMHLLSLSLYLLSSSLRQLP